MDNNAAAKKIWGGGKEYRLYDPVKKSILFSRNANFVGMNLNIRRALFWIQLPFLRLERDMSLSDYCYL
uniref:Uncharacterized protein n=1 Tax=Megaselia scalaris TaxID=36166 RepID=T1GE95_MEGSC